MGFHRVLGLFLMWILFAQVVGHRFPSTRHRKTLERMPVLVEEPDPEDNGPDVILDVDDVLNADEFPSEYTDGIQDVLKRYRVHTYARPWLDAVAACWREGHHLATPGDAKEARALGRLLKTAVTLVNITNTLMKDAMHIGVHSLGDEGTWQALEGENPRRTSWLGFNTDFIVQKKHEVRCAAVMSSGRYLYQRCGEKLIYACDTQYKKPEERKQIKQDDGYAALGSVPERRIYRLHLSPLSWTAARAMCLKERATLAVPVPARNEVPIVANGIFERPDLPSEVKKDGIFIGINDIAKEGQWKSELYSYMSFDGTWSSGDRPYNRSSNCGILISSGHFADAPCSKPKAFLCEKTVELDDDPEYEMVDGFGPYAFHVRSRKWIDAVVKCHSENATLAVPESNEEANAMEKLQRQALDRNGLKSDGDRFYVGVHDIDADRRWRTVDGKKILKTEGIGWSRYQQFFSRVTCAYLSKGVYGNMRCDFSERFICKKIP